MRQAALASKCLFVSVMLCQDGFVEHILYSIAKILRIYFLNECWMWLLGNPQTNKHSQQNNKKTDKQLPNKELKARIEQKSKKPIDLHIPTLKPSEILSLNGARQIACCVKVLIKVSISSPLQQRQPLSVSDIDINPVNANCLLITKCLLDFFFHVKPPIWLLHQWVILRKTESYTT